MKSYSQLYIKEIQIFGVFFVSAVAIVLLHLLLHNVRVLGMDTSIFYMDEKYTLAALFSTVTTFLIGFLVLTNLVEMKAKNKRIANLAYGIFFIALSFDEYFEIHEYTNTIIKDQLSADGILKTLANLSWIFPLQIIIFAVFILVLVKLKQSNQAVKLPIIIGMICFATVLIFELLGSATYGNNIYIYFIAIEEGLEMIGVSFFLLATLIENKTC